eukprot:6692913-Pyramimonas_sp.AAC.1
MDPGTWKKCPLPLLGASAQDNPAGGGRPPRCSPGRTSLTQPERSGGQEDVEGLDTGGPQMPGR